MPANLCTSFSAPFGSPSRTENGQFRDKSGIGYDKGRGKGFI